MRRTDYEAWIQATRQADLDAVPVPPAGRNGRTIADPPADFQVMIFGECEDDPPPGDRWLDELEYRFRQRLPYSCEVQK